MNKNKLKYTYTMDDGWYIGKLIERPDIMTQGETLEELEENLLDAYETIIDIEKKELAKIKVGA
ncbi:MAG: type II toxin-antitoxin system HicB family antitoxin [Chlamydiae bacterium]|nr:MAG: type II toxin-antitoxin system HicB family antitoxin [Chlamydiota bacterium]